VAFRFGGFRERSQSTSPCATRLRLPGHDRRELSGLPTRSVVRWATSTPKDREVLVPDIAFIVGTAVLFALFGLLGRALEKL